MKTLLCLLLLASTAFGEDRTFGWRASPHGVKGAPIETHPRFMAAPLPPAATVRQWFYFTDQKRRGACVAFTGDECVDAVHQKDFGTHVYLSYLDTYQRCLVADGNFPSDTGTFGGTLLKVLQKGVLTEALWPYSKPLNKLAPDTAANRAERLKHTTIKSYAIPNDDKGFAVKQAIANLQVAVPMGTYWYGNGMDAIEANCTTVENGKRVKVKRFVLPMPKGKPVGGHEVPIVSYDDNMAFPDGRVGGVEIHNHWKGFGDERGCCWIPQAWAFSAKYAEDKHVIELVNNSTKP